MIPANRIFFFNSNIALYTSSRFFHNPKVHRIINSSKCFGKNSFCRLSYSTRFINGVSSNTISWWCRKYTTNYRKRKLKALWFQRVRQILQHIKQFVYLQHVELNKWKIKFSYLEKHCNILHLNSIKIVLACEA